LNQSHALVLQVLVLQAPVLIELGWTNRTLARIRRGKTQKRVYLKAAYMAIYIAPAGGFPF
ncbi:MAG TPA: hypothetical protein VE267_02715, partial [Bradyrhizobium sp.]|nr:hypothetical protein [Bradyrhizobium sp.]